MLTRRQKNSLRGVTALLTCSALLAAVLIYTNISNATQTVPVAYAEILEGAVDYYDEDSDSAPMITLASNELMETMFSAEFATFIEKTSVSPLENDFIINTTEAPASYITESISETTEEEIDTEPDELLDISRIPDNPNEVTLLSEQLEDMTVPTTVSTTTSATTRQTTNTTTTTSYTTVQHTEQTPSTSVTTTEQTRNNYGTTAEPPRNTSGTSPVITTTTPPPVTTSLTSSQTTPSYASSRITTLPVSTTPTTPLPTTSTTTTPATTLTTVIRTTAPTGTGTSKTPFTNVGGGTFSTDDSIYLTMFSLVNNARKAAGLSELWYSARIHEICELRASELTYYYSHTRPNGSRFSSAFRDKGVAYKKCGENIAYGRNMFKTPEEVFDAWMDSESHRDNILSPDFECCAFGLSTLTVGKDTYYYWVQEFAKF